MDNLSIIIKALLEKKSKEDIIDEIKQIQNIIDKSPLKIKIDIDNAEFKQFTDNIIKINNNIAKMLDTNTSSLNKLSITMNTTNDGYEFMEKKIKETTDTQGNLIKEVSKFKQEVDEAGNAQTVLTKRTEETITNYKKQREEAEKLTEALEKQEQKEYVNKWTTKIKEIEERNKLQFKIDEETEKREQLEYVRSWTAKIKEVEERNKLKLKLDEENERREQEEYVRSWMTRIKEVEERAKLAQTLENFKLKMLGDGGEVVGQLDIFANKQKGRYDKSILDQLRKNIEALTIDTPNLGNEIKKLEIRFSSLKMQAAQSGNIMVRALENAYKFLRYYLVGGFLVRSVKEIKKAINSIVELDTSLTELNKVVDISNERISKFVDEAYELGNTLGRTGKQVIDATTEFARAGYTLEESFKLSKAALLMMNVAEGINTVEEASSSLISVLRSYKMEVSDAVKIVDILNAVSNTSATNFDNLSEGLRRTAGTLSQTGASLEELTGLLVGGFEPLRNIEQVSSGLVMISQRLRGIGEDGEAIEGLMPKLQEDFMRISNISIIDPETGGLRSTFDILQDMAKVFPTLTDMQRQYLSELAAGNRQVKVLNAILDNWENVEKAVKNATTSTGSAMKESEKFLNSIQGKLNLFSSAAQSMWNNAIDSNVIKFFIDLGTIIIKLIDRFGLLRTTVVLVTSALLLFNKGFLTFYSTNIASHFLGIANALKNLMLTLNMTTAAANATATAFAMIAPVAVFVAITGIIKLIGSWISKQKQLREEQEAFISNQSEKINALRAENEEVSSLISKYDELKSKTKTTAEEKEELHSIEVKLAQIFPETADGIDQQNQKFTTQIDLVKKLTQAKRDLAKEEMELFVAEGERQHKSWVTQRDRLKQEIRGLEESRETTKSFKQYYETLQRKLDEGTSGDEEWYGILEILQRGTLKRSFAHPGLFFDYMEKGENIEDWKLFNKQLEEKNTELQDVVGKIFEYYQTRDQLLEVPKGDSNKYDGFIFPDDAEDVEIYLDVPDRDRLKKLLDANKITLQQYYDSLLKIRKDQYSEYINKTSSELNKLLQDPIKTKSVESFLSLESELKSTYEKLQKDTTSSIKEYSPIPTRDALKQLLDTNKITLQYYYDQLLKIEDELYKGYANKSFSQLQAELQSSDESVATRAKGFLSLFSERQSVGKTLSNNALAAQTEEAKKAIEDFEKSLLPFKNTLSDINYQIDRYNEILKQTPEEKQEPILLKINELLKQKKNTLHELNETNRAQLATLEPTSEEYRKLEAEIKATSLEWWKLDNQQRANIKTMDDYVAKLEELSKKEEEERQQKLDQQKKEAKELIDSYRNYIVEGINEEIEALEKSKRAAKDAADAKIAAIQLQIEILERQNAALKEQEDREKRLSDLAKQREKVANIEKNRDTRMLIDGEWVYVANPRKLREETERLAEMEEDYIKWERDLKDKKVIEDLRNQIKAIQDSLEAEEDGYDKRIEQLREFIKDQNKLWNRQEDQITSYEQLLDRLSEYEKEIYIDRLKELNNFVSEYNKLTSTLSPIPSTSSGGSTYTPTSSESTSSSIQMWNPTTKQLSTVSAHAVSKYQQMGWTTNVPTDEELRKMIEKLKGFDTGGYTGTWGKDGKLAFLHEKEIVLKQDDTTNLLKGITMLRDIVPTLKSIQFKVPELKFPKAALAGAGATNYYVNINKVETPDAESFMDLVPTLALQYRNKR